MSGRAVGLNCPYCNHDSTIVHQIYTGMTQKYPVGYDLECEACHYRWNYLIGVDEG